MILLGDTWSWVVREGARPGATQHTYTCTHARMHTHAPTCPRKSRVNHLLLPGLSLSQNPEGGY